MAYPTVDPQPSFPALEAEVLAFWEGDKTFPASIDARPAGANGANEYVFYDGPPFANGLPHYGHLLTGFVKDAVPRYQTMRGRRVERRFGWDCHGLPAEVETEKELGLSGRPEIVEYGVGRFNEACRTSVLRYTNEWERYVTRQARWVDFANDYKTLDLPYMESVMWAFRSLWDKGLVYEGFRVLAYCWRCETPLSNTETRMDDVYRDRQDPALTVWFELEPTEDRPSERILAWTTTPWTLPSNLALAVGPDIDYAVMEEDGQRYLLAEARLGHYERELAGATRVGTVKGAELVGRRYAPLFPFFADQPNAFRVLAADFVSTEDGTGVVHLSPGHGEEDQNVCNANGIDTVVPMDAQGRYTAEIEPWAGMHVFDANPLVIRALKDAGRVVRHETLRPPVPALLALRQAARVPGRVVLVRAGDGLPGPHGGAQPGDHLGARAHQGRQLRQVAGQRPRLVDQPQPLLGLTDPGLEERRPPLPARRRLRQPRRAGAGLRCPTDRPPPPDGRRARAAQPGRPDRPVDDAAGARGARLLVRVRLHAVRPGALPLREPGVVRGPLPGRLHRRVHRPDPRLVLHAPRAGDGPVRPAGVPDLHQPRHPPRRRRPEDVEEPAQLPRSVRGVRHVRLRRHALVPAVVPRAAGRRPRRERVGHPRLGAPGAAAAVERVVLPVAVRQRRRHGRARADRRDRRARPLPPGQDPRARRRGDGVHGRVGPLRRLRGRAGPPRQPHELVHPPQPRAASGPASRTPSTRCTRSWPRWSGSPRRSCRSSPSTSRGR